MSGRGELASRYRAVRAATERLREGLSAEDCVVQSMPDASPTKWHLAHTSWFFETFVLERKAEHSPFHPDYRVLFNSYYQTVGARHPRPDRGMLTRPSLEDVLAYRSHVDEEMLEVLASEVPAEVAAIVDLGLHHEQQHQELILTDLKYLLAQNPLRPTYRTRAEAALGDAPELGWHAEAEGLRWIGHDGGGFAFDNEGPRHRVFLTAFELASRPTTNGEFLRFVEDRGYGRPELWLSDGWNAVEGKGWSAPLYWEKHDGRWSIFTLSGLRELDLSEPVCHVSFYEADAYARWAGARLPTETEWEALATDAPVEGTFLESERFHPAPASADGKGSRLFGDVWQWTGSAYAPYPGYRPLPGALGEYNGKFMANQLVLRGGSCATPRSHVRASYRNFFPPEARWQFSGVRLARYA